MVRVQDKFRGQNSTNGEVECIGENIFIKALFRISFDLKKKNSYDSKHSFRGVSKQGRNETVL